MSRHGVPGTTEEVKHYFDRAAPVWDTFYDGQRNRLMQWADWRFRRDVFERFRLTFETMGPIEGKTVLDVGCGSGVYCIEAARRGARVTGIDVAPGMIEMARTRARESGLAEACRFIVAGFPGQVRPEQHDHAVVMGVMDYVLERADFLAALRPCVRESAMLSFPSIHWCRTPLRKVRYRLKRCPVYFYERGQIETLMTTAGFPEVTVHKIPGAGMDYFVVGKAGTLNRDLRTPS